AQRYDGVRGFFELDEDDGTLTVGHTGLPDQVVPLDVIESIDFKPRNAARRGALQIRVAGRPLRSPHGGDADTVLVARRNEQDFAELAARLDQIAAANRARGIDLAKADAVSRPQSKLEQARARAEARSAE